jgi:hypothetical protein
VFGFDFSNSPRELRLAPDMESTPCTTGVALPLLGHVGIDSDGAAYGLWVITLVCLPQMELSTPPRLAP